MSRAISAVLGTVVVLLLCASSGHAQGCATILTPHFSVYTSVTRDGKNIYTSVTMQGYASIGSSAGCNMSTATHHVGAENVLNGTAHWSYSPNGCPSCSFSVTNNEQIVGTPGVNYPFTYEGDAICSMVGQFFTSSGNGGQLPGCVVPSGETTVYTGPAATTGDYSTIGWFSQNIHDSAGDNFAARDVEEGVASAGVDTCHFSGSMVAPFTNVTGGTWTVAGGDTSGQYNTWGFDQVGWFASNVNYYRTQAAAHKTTLPCSATLYQSMKIMCNANTWVVYTPLAGNRLTLTINSASVVNCRYDISGSACGTINK
jgi:hypothetical protein